MKKELPILFTFLFLSNVLFAQKEYNIWYFGDHAGITFNTNPPTVLTDGQMYSSESSSGICDKNGNLLFYTDGDTTWNRDHEYMKSAVSSQNWWASSSVQGSIVVPKPDSDSLYYIFTTDAGESRSDSLRYSVVNMKGDNGKGEIITIDKGIFSGTVEGMALTIHANRQDFWIGAADYTNRNFNLIRTVNGEINASILSVPLDSFPFVIMPKFSPDSKILYAYGDYSAEKGKVFYLYHFDNATGTLSDKIGIKRDVDDWTGVEFSHDSKFLYASYPSSYASGAKGHIVQYDLSNWNEDSINASRVEIESMNNIMDEIIGMQLGPDRKIYLFDEFRDSISVIEYPYRKGTACGFRRRCLSLNGGNTVMGTPYYPTYLYKSMSVELGNDTTLCEGDSLLLESKVPQGTHVSWSTGDTGTTIIVRQSGNYIVTVTNQLDTAIDSIKVTVGKKFPVYLGSDTAFCGQFLFWLKAEKNAKSYHWNTGDTSFSILVDQPGMYAVAIMDSNSCPAGDTILIDQLVVPSIGMHYDSVNCRYVTLDASPRQKGARYEWSTGDTTLIIRAEQNGEYRLTISNLFCSINQTIVISNISKLCDKMTYYIPNAFTPGNDGLNEMFKVVGTNIEQVTMKIYNRWGGKIYEGSEWDGNDEANPCQQDAYIYLITITGTDKGKPTTKYVSGTVTLLR